MAGFWYGPAMPMDVDGCGTWNRQPYICDNDSFDEAANFVQSMAGPGFWYEGSVMEVAPSSSPPAPALSPIAISIDAGMGLEEGIPLGTGLGLVGGIPVAVARTIQSVGMCASVRASTAYGILPMVYGMWHMAYEICHAAL